MDILNLETIDVRGLTFADAGQVASRAVIDDDYDGVQLRHGYLPILLDGCGSPFLYGYWTLALLPQHHLIQIQESSF